MLKPQYNPFRSARKGRLSFATSGNKTVDLITLESADPLERNSTNRAKPGIAMPCHE
jgi:hypothetical protein